MPAARADLRDAAVVLTDVGLTRPDGTVTLSGISAALGAGRTGLVGANGAGKSTLLRIVAGDLTPTRGRVHTSGPVGYLPQALPLAVRSTVADLLGVRERIAALRALEAGAPDADRHLAALADDWDVEDRATAALRPLGLAAADLDRPVGGLSGGEAILVATAGLRLRGAPITLLDEPTNNLDRTARTRLYDLVAAWRGALVVVSHDPALLDLMDDTAELYAGRLTVFGGPHAQWRAHLDREQAAARRAERTAEQALRTERRQRVEAETKLARRARYARTDYVNKRRPRVIMKLRAAEAQVSAGKLRTEYDEKVAAARTALESARARLREDHRIRIDLPDPGLARGRRLAELWGTNRTYTIRGPERVALVGANGVGKTTLVERLVYGVEVPARAVAVRAVLTTERVGYLPQRLDGLDEGLSALDNVRAAAPGVAPGVVRGRLARFLLRGDAAERAVAGLSGGERFRVALARLLLAEPPAELLVLDEPTNNLDGESVDQLVDALTAYRGALLVVSHDDAFLARLHLTSVLELGADGALADCGPVA
ncbi:ABC transporter [Pilimelia anulata]|uniref:ABC transporter n=1 Tax=Pilimelia anulata TaxID=53371 RepID=A0A8J3BES4_9ACTN|nr:ATP-binding cassette domain-containing protein [Pilimelia anulata]GGK09785.1 ABC transporter [Pilimelia anulata]